MKILTATLALAAAGLIAGSAPAQTAQRGAAPGTGASPPPAVDPNRDHIDQDAQREIPGAAGFPANLGSTPVNGVGGTGGGRMSLSRLRVINNSETEATAAEPDSGGGRPDGPQALPRGQRMHQPFLVDPRAEPATPAPAAPVPPR